MKPIVIIALLLAPLTGFAQDEMTPREYFNSAARNFLDGKKRDAIQTLNAGLEAHPGDERMLKLAEELLKEMEQQQQQQQDQQQKQQQEQQEQEKENGSSGDSDPQEKGEQESDQGNPEEQDGDGEQQDGDSQQQEGNPEEQNGEGDEQADADTQQPGEEGGNEGEQNSSGQGQELPPEAGKLSREQAARLLKSLNEQDKNTKAKVMRAQQGQKKGKSKKPEKDW